MGQVEVTGNPHPSTHHRMQLPKGQAWSAQHVPSTPEKYREILEPGTSANHLRFLNLGFIVRVRKRCRGLPKPVQFPEGLYTLQDM